jgi:metal-sulfur cluster biosynthetic enzyme
VSAEKDLKLIEDQSLKTHVLEKLASVIDPELGIDIVNIGLVYKVQLFEGGFCEIQMTLTTMDCPFAETIEAEVKEALAEIPQIRTSRVKYIWYPAWNPERMSRYARIALGMQ